MPTLAVFNHISLDGFFVDRNSDMSWAHKSDPEWDAFANGNASGGGRLVFGRVTYEMMASFWPTPLAMERMPVVAQQMNQMQKIVFSKSMQQASWNNTMLINGDIITAMQALKNEPGDDMVILGSGSIIAQLAAAHLIDTYQIVVNPVVLGSGRTLFEGIKERIALKLTNSRTFRNGNVVLFYEPSP